MISLKLKLDTSTQSTGTQGPESLSEKESVLACSVNVKKLKKDIQMNTKLTL